MFSLILKFALYICSERNFIFVLYICIRKYTFWASSLSNLINYIEVDENMKYRVFE